MRKIVRSLAIPVALLAVLLDAEATSARQSLTPGQRSLETGTIVVDGREMGSPLFLVPVVIHVQSVARQVNLVVTVGNISVASFNDLLTGDYLIEISASGYQPAEIEVPVTGGQVVKVLAEVTGGASPGFSLKLLAALPAQPPEPALTTALALARKDENPVKAEGASACQLEKIIQNTSKRLEEFVGNVNRISAIEVLEHERLDKHGKVVEHEKRQFNYVAIIEETVPGAFSVDEYRDGNIGTTGGFPRDIATVGMPLLAMIFHPSHLDEFEMNCDGSTAWHERPVWRVRFQQRKDRPARMSGFRVKNEMFPVLLRGTAWIDAGSYQIVHLETELLEPIPQVKLYSEQQALDYGPVQFKDSKMNLWLPQAAEIYLDSGGRHFHHRHSYSKYQLFSVDVGQKIGSPK
jgi:hypothetical protein